MTEASLWRHAPPSLPATVADLLCDDGSLTARLMALPGTFSVRVLEQGPGLLLPDEVAIVSRAPHGVHHRHVALQLNCTTVVLARSVVAADAPHWTEILARGSRPLGLSLFGELPGVSRTPLEFAELTAPHPLPVLAGLPGPLPARRSTFWLNGEPLLLTEMFLPALKEFLR